MHGVQGGARRGCKGVHGGARGCKRVKRVCKRVHGRARGVQGVCKGLKQGAWGVQGGARRGCKWCAWAHALPRVRLTRGASM